MPWRAALKPFNLPFLHFNPKEFMILGLLLLATFGFVIIGMQFSN